MGAGLQAGDLFFTHGDRWLSGKIRTFSRERGEPVTWANHVGVVVAPGTIETALASEAIGFRVPAAHTLPSVYRGRRDLLSIWRSANIPADELRAIVEAVRAYEGRLYGWSKVFLHAFGLGRFSRIDGLPICSWMAGKPFVDRGYSFGRPANEIQPDDMLDFCEREPEKWVQVWPDGEAELTRWAAIE